MRMMIKSDYEDPYSSVYVYPGLCVIQGVSRMSMYKFVKSLITLGVIILFMYSLTQII